MIRARVKICGITNYEDAKAAVEMGADILGFNFYQPSPRYIDPDEAVEIIKKLPSYVDISGVFVNAEETDIRKLTDSGLLNWVQFHGDESPEFIDLFETWNLRTIKGVRVRTKEDIQQAEQFRTFALLFDAFDPNQYGGTGKTFDWSLLQSCSRPIFLAGGVCSSNVAEALSVDIYGVDVCSGIESQPGKKDHQKMKQLFSVIDEYTGNRG